MLGLALANKLAGPSGSGSGYFPSWKVLPGNLPPGMVYSGASLRTQVNADGSLGYGPHNLLPGARDFASASWLKVNATATTDSVAGPDGSLSAGVITATASGAAYVYRGTSGAVNMASAVQVKVKKGTADYCVLNLSSNIDRNCWFNLNTGAFETVHASCTTTVTTQSGGFYLITVSVTNTPTSPFLVVGPATGNGSMTAAAGATVVVCDGQVNAGAAQPYYPTTSAPYFGLRTQDYSADPTKPGILIEPQATNLFLNSETPATQNITVTAQAYTLSCYGTGSIVLSGTGSGTLNGPGSATGRTSLTFTPTAGTLTLTVSGTAKVQLESGSVASSYIPTAASQVTRAADVLYWPIASIPGFGTSGTLVMEVIIPDKTGADGSYLLSPNTTDGLLYRGSGYWKTYDGTNGLQTPASGPPTAQFNTGVNKVAVSWGGGVRTLCANGNPARSSAGAAPSGSQLNVLAAFGAISGGSLYSLRYYPQALPDATMQALTA